MTRRKIKEELVEKKTVKVDLVKRAIVKVSLVRREIVKSSLVREIVKVVKVDLVRQELMCLVCILDPGTKIGDCDVFPLTFSTGKQPSQIGFILYSVVIISPLLSFLGKLQPMVSFVIEHILQQFV